MKPLLGILHIRKQYTHNHIHATKPWSQKSVDKIFSQCLYDLFVCINKHIKQSIYSLQGLIDKIDRGTDQYTDEAVAKNSINHVDYIYNQAKEFICVVLQLDDPRLSHQIELSLDHCETFFFTYEHYIAILPLYPRRHHAQYIGQKSTRNI